jgi:hypothetical protein
VTQNFKGQNPLVQQDIINLAQNVSPDFLQMNQLNPYLEIMARESSKSRTNASKLFMNEGPLLTNEDDKKSNPFSPINNISRLDEANTFQ